MEYRPADLREIELADPVTNAAPLALPVAGQLTPPQIAVAYNIPSATGYGVKVGIFSFGGGFKQSDLNSSFNDLKAAGLISSSLTAPTIKQVLKDGQTGAFTTGGASGENTVDIYCVACMAPQADITIYIGNSYSSMMTAAIADGMNIITISWGSSEYTSDEQWFSQANAAGITVCCSSGDSGSTVTSGSTQLGVVYPASSPYTLGIGGTKLTLNTNNTRASESDDNRDPSFGSTWGGGGGISTTFSRPTWQNGLTYIPITNGVTGSATALTTRGVPDISAPMNSYAVYFNGTISGYGGTSLSSPIVAGILARLLQLTGTARGSQAWNTIFYANTGAFFDIIVGTNNTTITSGYAGSNGWDPVTGLGPPVGTSLYGAVRKGAVFPKLNYGSRTQYPRVNGANRVAANN